MAVPISNVTRRVVLAASGLGPYSFTFEILVNTDISVYRDDTLLTLTTDYTVTINTNGTGFVTLTATPTGATQIAIVGDRAIQRTSDFVTGGDLFANTINDELDSMTIFAQQNAEGVERSLKAPQTDPTSISMVLPSATSRANKVLSFDASGNPETINTIASLNDVAAVVNEIVEVSGITQAIEDLDAIKDEIETVSGLSANINSLANHITQIDVIGDDLAGTDWNYDLGSIADPATGATGVPTGYLVTAYNNLTDIQTVSTNIANVNSVGGSIASVNSVAGELGAGQDVTVVAANLSGTDTIGTVAGSISNVNTVAGISANVTTVAGISANVTSVAGNSTNINTVAGNNANITTVAGVSANVTTVAGISANVTTVAGISADVTTVATSAVGVGSLADISALTPSDGQFIVGNGTTWVGENGSTVRNSLLPSLATNAGKVLAVNTGATDVEWITAGGGGGSGDVVGPASATDNAVVRFDGTTGKLVQNSAVTVADTTGNITGGTYNKVTITAPATGSTLTVADGKTLTANNSLTLSGTDSTTITFPSTSATVARTDAGQTFTGDQAIAGNLTLNTQGDVRFADSDSSNWVAFQGPATVSSNVTWTLPSVDGTNGQALVTNGTGTLSWAAPSGGGQFEGSAANKAIFWNAQSIAENITITGTHNAGSIGPITIDSGFTVTIDSGARWVVI
jgi:hypothetical protein